MLRKELKLKIINQRNNTQIQNDTKKNRVTTQEVGANLEEVVQVILHNQEVTQMIILTQMMINIILKGNTVKIKAITEEKTRMKKGI